jgi:hypothetical protein
MPIEYKTPDPLLPTELRLEIEKIFMAMNKDVVRRMNTPHPENPNVPSYVPITLGRQQGAARRMLIDKWNKDHPDTETEE